MGSSVVKPVRSGWRRVGLRSAVSLASLLIGLCVLEGALRLRRGQLTDFASVHRSSDILNRGVPLEHDPELGWRNVPGARFTKGPVRISIDAAGFRQGTDARAQPRPLVLAVGDSFTFGLEADDAHTWPALLEAQLGTRVQNGGVTAYGFDQVVLRAEALVPELRPDLLIVCLVADDVNRCQYSYRWGSRKPWFVLDETAPGGLRLHGRPVSAGEPPRARFASLRQALGYSHLADAVLTRAAPEWWLGGRGIEMVHREGVRVAERLVERLGRLESESGVPILFVVEWARASERRLVEPLLEKAREVPLTAVLDLSRELEAAVAADPSMLADSHLSGSGNEWVAERLLPHVRALLGP